MVDNTDSHHAAATCLSANAENEAAKAFNSSPMGYAIVLAIMALTRAVLSVAEEIYRKGS